MIRGEFIRADGLVIPNNVTSFGVQTLLAAALRNTVPTFFVGLVDAAPDPGLIVGQCIEPTIGVNGYQRVAIERSSLGWPGSGSLNGQPWLETDFLVWTAVGGPFDQTIQRLMLVNTDGTGEEGVDELVMALSTPLPLAITVDVGSPDADRKFKYRLYGI